MRKEGNSEILSLEKAIKKRKISLADYLQKLNKLIELGRDEYREHYETLFKFQKRVQTENPEEYISDFLKLPIKDAEIFLDSLSHNDQLRLIKLILYSASEERYKKLAKRTLHILRSRGMNIELEEPKNHFVPFQIQKELKEWYKISPIIGSGERIAFGYRKGPVSGLLAILIIKDTIGFEDGEILSVSSGKAKKIVENIMAKNPKVPLIDVDRDYFRELIALLWERSSIIVKEDKLKELKSWFSKTSGERKNYLLRLVNEQELPSENEVRFKLKELVANEIFSFLKIEQEEFEMLSKQLLEIQTSPIILTQEQLNERIENALRGMARRLCEEQAKIWTERLVEDGYLFFKLGKKEIASFCARICRSFSEGLGEEFLFELISRDLRIRDDSVRDSAGLIESPEDFIKRTSKLSRRTPSY